MAGHPTSLTAHNGTTDLGQDLPGAGFRAMSVHALTSDIPPHRGDRRFVPQAAVDRCSKPGGATGGIVTRERLRIRGRPRPYSNQFFADRLVRIAQGRRKSLGLLRQ